ncbi:M23 family metallopeptidase [Pandoraea sp.]|uniref:M23 family metallopeptidase n=1 Tax=Pandoraea sp. TaxID=1883445 RepID=UPI0026010D02|nr:M23 family metallopeptidase [Pandoraea sp.]
MPLPSSTALSRAPSKQLVCVLLGLAVIAVAPRGIEYLSGRAAAPTDDALDASGDASSAANDATVAPSASPPAPAPYVTRSVTIERSFDSAALKAGVSPQVAASLVKAFSSEIDFRRDLQKGDSFTLVFKRNGIDGDDVAADRKPVAAKIDLGSTTHTIYWYRKPGGEGSYYTPNGSSTLPAFSRYPIAFTRVSSPFSLARFDPVLKRVRPHDGVDLAAPVGTPVHATATGRVKFVGWQRGYGKVVILSNPNDFSTLFAHLSRFAHGLRRGEAVQRGQVIGYVGETGWATGPHLHFELRRDNVPVNPLTARLPVEHRLKGADKERFASQAQKLSSFLSS